MRLRHLWLIAWMVVATGVAHAQPAIPNPGIALQGADHYSFMVGNVKITRCPMGPCLRTYTRCSVTPRMRRRML
jgi:hypothetical protein